MSDASPEPFTVLITLQVKPGREAEFLGLLAPVLNAMRHEPSFLNTILHQNPADPCRFLLYETWTDRRDLVEVQMHRPYRTAFEARLPALLERPRQVEIWQSLRADYAFRSG
jgi:quinol monooxygenase YgiN